MAACTTYTSVIVSGAGTTQANGTYLPAGLQSGNQVYTKDGNVNSYPKLHRPSGTFWSITTNTPFPGAPLYYETAETISQCPPSGTAWSVGPFGSADAPTVIGITAGPDCSIPANRCAFAAGGESGRSRFRRLVALGYV